MFSAPSIIIALIVQAALTFDRFMKRKTTTTMPKIVTAGLKSRIDRVGCWEEGPRRKCARRKYNDDVAGQAGRLPVALRLYWSIPIVDAVSRRSRSLWNEDYRRIETSLEPQSR